MEYSKIRFHDKPTIKRTVSKEYHIRKARDDSIYQIITHEILNNVKTLASIEYFSEEKYEELFPSEKMTRINYKEEYEKLKVTLESILKKYEILQCNNCKEYSQYYIDCDLCDTRTCGCIKIVRVQSWHLSGTYMCEKCLSTHCHFCLVTKGAESEEGKNLCQKCENRFEKN